jgi:xylan 1,4-beta-xylosidase
VRVESSAGLPLSAVRDTGVRATADVNALATRSNRSVAVFLWHYHDDDLPAPPAAIELAIQGVPARTVRMTHERIDGDHSNAYDAWKRLGSPQPPSEAQYDALERDGRLQPLEAERRITASAGEVRMTFMLPRQGVSLIRVTW